jgi:branched-subunit amino acid aminotransferase/4-amino-4-deoxychorismate lyase
MLQSYLAYKQAKESGAYDALLINNKGYITEGTRTNFFCIKDNIIYTPAENEILLGVTRKALLKVAIENGYTVQEEQIRLEDVSQYDGAFISSTSSKIVPIKSIDGQDMNPKPDTLKRLMVLFDDFLAASNGTL